MPLVFVHGVNTRKGGSEAEKSAFATRERLLKEQFGVAFADRVKATDGLKAFTPYWGDLGVKFARNLACLPKSGVQALAVGQPLFAELVASTAAKLDADVVRLPALRTGPLVTVAKVRSLSAAVDLLFAGSANVQQPGPLAQQMTNALPDVARFVAAAEQYAAANPQPAWLVGTQNDATFVDQLYKAVTAYAAANTAKLPAGTGPKVQSLGVGSDVLTWLKQGATAVKTAATAVVNNVKAAVAGAATDATRSAFLELSGYVRPAASALAGRFVGDVFTYLESRKEIADRVLSAVREADNARRTGDQELYLVGHSFGGIILYDILTSFEPTLKCDLYVTVGSQVALFAEMGRLAAAADVAGAFAKEPTAPRPAAAARWLNIYDLTDYFGFGAQGVFSGVEDFEFETDALPLVSHSAYFDTPRFFARLRERVNVAFT
ncbi:hypothetical protein [Bradyrhizobium liaoningense]